MSDTPTPDEIRTQFSWTDPTVYEWTVANPSQDVAEFVGFLLGAAVVFPALLYGALYLMSFVWADGAFWFAAGLFAIVLIAWVVLFVRGWSSPREALARDDSEHWLPIFGLGLLIYVMTGPGTWLADSFTGPTDQITEWLAYFADNVISVLLLDIPEVYELRISNISYDDRWSRLATVLFRLLVTAGLVEFALNFYRTRYLEQNTYATVADFYRVCDSLPDEEGMVYTMRGRVTALDPVEGGVEQFLEAFKPEAEADEDEDE